MALRRIVLRDFVIVSELELELGSQFTVLTGETGAGKSILLDALGLCLGDKADAQAVRHGADKAELTALFDLQQQPQAAAWLAFDVCVSMSAQVGQRRAGCAKRSTHGVHKGWLGQRRQMWQTLGSEMESGMCSFSMSALERHCTRLG